VGCGWAAGYKMCLVNGDPVSCGVCATMSRCGPINCLQATRPCDCAALGGLCGWSTSEWRCESGKDTDCNECSEQTECGGPGLSFVYESGCPTTVPSQLQSCSKVMSCPYDKKCCKRCAGQKQVCAETDAQCDGQTWEVQLQQLVCPDCHDYYYDDAYYAEDAPSEPLNITATLITSTSATLSWKTPKTNFKQGTDGYSVAYAPDKGDPNSEKVKILDTTTALTAPLTDLSPATSYKISILPVVNATEVVGMAGTYEFTTLAAAASAAPAGKKKKGKLGKAGKTGKAAVAPTPAPVVTGKGKAGKTGRR